MGLCARNVARGSIPQVGPSGRTCGSVVKSLAVMLCALTRLAMAAPTCAGANDVGKTFRSGNRAHAVALESTHRRGLTFAPCVEDPESPQGLRSSQAGAVASPALSFPRGGSSLNTTTFLKKHLDASDEEIPRLTDMAMNGADEWDGLPGGPERRGAPVALPPVPLLFRACSPTASCAPTASPSTSRRSCATPCSRSTCTWTKARSPARGCSD